MRDEVKVLLKDIEQAIEEIGTFLPDKNNFYLFQKDLKGRRAIERNLEIIGEAVSRILKLDPDFQISNSRKIVDTRNRIIHGYDTVSEEILWSIVTRNLPTLYQEIKNFLK